MRNRIFAGAVLFAVAVLNGGCAAIPFIPLMASVPKLLLPPPAPPVQPVAESKPHEQDPVVREAISKPPLGDAGVMIPQLDRVAYQPEAEGSIPLRVAAVDLVSDLKAHAVGDIVTVNVSEAISTEAKAGTTISNQRAISAGIPNLFGAAESVAKHNPMVNLGSLINASSNNATTGTGDMSAQDTFVATVSAIVIAVNPSGTLSIKGDRHVQVNGEDDTINLSGVVRPEDLDSNNSIPSSEVADLEIRMLGQGQVRDKQGNGLGTRIFDWVWAF
ncbi:MAG TPA: flagellar basal body L-ring protein FlgH [Candidatus Binataceae bacterium]|nr:flagellar basal body L-ring protein FlgH [Candidatus Binataceae bacterium]